jgi:hypothetical protein
MASCSGRHSRATAREAANSDLGGEGGGGSGGEDGGGGLRRTGCDLVSLRQQEIGWLRAGCCWLEMGDGRQVGHAPGRWRWRRGGGRRRRRRRRRLALHCCWEGPGGHRRQNQDPLQALEAAHRAAHLHQGAKRAGRHQRLVPGLQHALEMLPTRGPTCSTGRQCGAHGHTAATWLAWC